MVELIYKISLPFAVIGLIAFLSYTFKRHRMIFSIATIASIVTFICVTITLLQMGIQFGLGIHSGVSSRYLNFAWVIMTIYFLAEFRYRIRLLGSILMPVALMLILISMFDNKKSSAASMSVGNIATFSHMSLVFIGIALLFLAFGASILFLTKRRALKNHLAAAIDDRLPSLTKITRMMETSFNIGFPALTIGIILGIIYAGSILESGWIWDKKMVLALASWSAYSILFFLHQSRRLNSQVFARGIIVLFLFILASFLFTSHQLTPKTTTNVHEETKPESQ